MIALPRALRRFHFAQKGIHFGNGQAAVRAHGTMAGHGGEQRVARLGHAAGRAVLSQVDQHVAQQCFDIAFGEQCRHATKQQRLRAAPAEVETEFRERGRLAFGDVRLALRHCDGDRHEQRLDADAFAIVRGLELFVADALVRGVHVDHDQAFRALGQDVDAVQLGDGVAERRQGGVVVGRQ